MASNQKFGCNFQVDGIKRSLFANLVTICASAQVMCPRLLYYFEAYFITYVQNVLVIKSYAHQAAGYILYNYSYTLYKPTGTQIHKILGTCMQALMDFSQ